MSLKHYYQQEFRADLATLLSGIPAPEARSHAVGLSWMEGCHLLPRVPFVNRPQFLTCLFLTVLADQAMQSHYLFVYRRFEELTQYPKFTMELDGYEAYLNPELIFEIPIQKQFVEEAKVKKIIPEAMALFVAEIASVLTEHIPEVLPRDFFRRLLDNQDVNPTRRWTFRVQGAFCRPLTISHPIAQELAKAVLPAFQSTTMN